MEEIQLHTHERVLHIQFNRLSKKNALNSAMYAAWAKALQDAATNPSIHTVVITGDNTCFTAGNDLSDFNSASPDKLAPIVHLLHVLSTFPKPLIAGVAGPCVGIGSTMLLHCDYVVAHTSALFAMPFAQLGLVPEAGSSLLLAKRVGTLMANEWLLFAKRFTAEQALAQGMVNTVVSTSVVDAALATAKTLCALPIGALVESKKLLRDFASPELAHCITQECQIFAQRLQSVEAQQAITAFFHAKN